MFTTGSFSAFLGALICFAGVGIAAQNRIPASIESAGSVPLQGNIHPNTRLGNDGGEMEPGRRINGLKLMLAQSVSQRAALKQFLEEQRDPSSPDYQNWLTPEQYGERFGLSENDLAAITSWLKSQGFAIEQVARARNWITFNGTAGQIGVTFRTALHRVELDGEVHFANTTEPWIPASLNGIVSEIRGLDDFRPKPQHTRLVLHPEFNNSNGAHFLSPDDLAAIYDIQPLYKAGFDGTGQKLVIAGQTDINLADLRAFRAQFNLAAKDPQLALFGADPGANQGDQAEADLDLEWSGAVARNATIVYAYSQNVFDSLQYAIDQNLGPVISVSYGGCELSSAASFRTIAQQANAQGITWMNASGDSGAAGCDAGANVATHGPAVIFPADIPEVTAVGGTEFNEASGSYWSLQNNANFESALSYIPEIAWNDTASGSGLESGGGGASVLYAKPWWQTGPGVPNDNARDVPDVSLTASALHDGYVMYSRGELMVVGGTSASSPSFAGIVSIVNQFLLAKGVIAKPGLGNINPTLYNLAQKTTGVFHDITAGNNIVPCAAGSKGCVNGSFGYTAGPGYDLATGLGSVDAFNLVTKWTVLPPTTGTTMTLTASPAAIASSATVQLTATITAVSGANTPAGSVTFAIGNTVLGSAVLGGSGPTAAATLAVKGASLASGSNIVTASYAATATFSNSTAVATVSVTAAPVSTVTTVTASPTVIAQSASTVLTATVKPATGTNVPAGSVAFAVGNTSLGTVNLVASAAGSVATLSINGASLAVGSDTINASYTAAGNFSDSNGSVGVTATPTSVKATIATATITTAAATPASIAASGSTQVSAAVKSTGGTGTPTGTVTFSVGNKSLGAAPLSNPPASAIATATLSVPGSSLATGSNGIVATYAGNVTFGGSVSPAVIVTVAPPVIATNTVMTATPAAILQSSATVLTAVVKAASGSGAPAGNVLFAIGNNLLGNAALNASGAAALTVKGASLALGQNNITATYVPAGNFASSSSSATVSVTAAPAPTTTTVSASRGSGSSTTTLLTATVKASSGSITPTGSVNFALGAMPLGSAVLAGSGTTATATFAWNTGSLTAGNDTISAVYPGNAQCNGSAASVVVTVSGPVANH